MIKKNKLTILITSIVTLLPALLWLFGSQLLPAKVVEFWGMDVSSETGLGTANIFLILPLILLAVHWFGILFTAIIEKNNEPNKKMLHMVLWITPVLSLATSGGLLATAFSEDVNVFLFVLLGFGIGFMIMGNYMPKVTRNRTVGIKITWTLANEENWFATHRFAGKVFFASGLACLLAILLPVSMQPFVAGAIFIAIVVLPIVYSYRFYKKQLREGKATKQDYEQGLTDLYKSRRAAILAILGVLLSLGILLPLILFGGKLEIAANEQGIQIDASMWRDCTIAYEQIESAEYRESTVDGQRINGVGSAKLLLGVFRNAEFGTYIRYTYTGNLPCIVLHVDGETYVIATSDAAATQAIYETITQKIGK